MPFDLLEKSAFGGNPEELYEFTMETTKWRVTSGSLPSIFNGYTFEPLKNLRRTKVKQSRGGSDDSISLTVPFTFPIAEMFAIAPPPLPIQLTIYRRHRGDGNNFGLSFVGRVRSCQWGDATAELHCDGGNSKMKRATLRMGFDPRCPHIVYQVGCNLDPEDFKVLGTVTARTKNTLTASEFATKPNDWLALGYVKYGGYHFMISHHVADVITLYTPVNILNLPEVINCEAYAGCDRLLDTCWNKFNNGLNSEANPGMPNKNPFVTGL